METTRIVADRYLLVEAEASSGGLQRWRANDTAREEPVSVTLFGEDDGFRDQLLGELRRFAHLNHPNIDGMLDLGIDGNDVFVVRERLRGQRLDERLATGPLTPRALQGVADRMLGALIEVHAHGLVHYWLLTSTVFIIRTPSPPTVKLLDTGVQVSRELMDELDPRVRIPGRLGYRLPYSVAPERLREPAIRDHRSDLYSVGCVAYQALTGQPPFTGESALEIACAHLSRSPPPLSASVPEKLAAWIMKLLSKSPSDRYPTAEDALTALRATAF